MITIDEFRIRKVDYEDSEFLIDLRSDHQVNEMLGNFLLLNKTSQLKWIEDLQVKKDAIYFIFEIKKDDNWIRLGLIRINDIDYVNRSASVGGDIAKEFRGRGYSKMMYKFIFKCCFEYLNLNRLWLLVLENNIIATNLYIKLGFVKEGVQRKAIFRKGNYLNYIMMSILKEEFFNEK